MLRAANIIFWLALNLWIAAVVSGAIAAYAVFGELPTMSVHLPRYHAAPAAEHGMIAAGHVMQRVFRVTDIMQAVAAPVAILAMICDVVMQRDRRRWMSNALRIVCMAVAAAALAYRAIDLTPRMDRALHAYRAASQSGDVEAAKARRAEFSALHPPARMLMTSSLVMLLAAAGTSAVALGPRQGGAGARMSNR